MEEFVLPAQGVLRVVARPGPASVIDLVEAVAEGIDASAALPVGVLGDPDFRELAVLVFGADEGGGDAGDLRVRGEAFDLYGRSGEVVLSRPDEEQYLVGGHIGIWLRVGRCRARYHVTPQGLFVNKNAAGPGEGQPRRKQARGLAIARYERGRSGLFNHECGLGDLREAAVERLAPFAVARGARGVKDEGPVVLALLWQIRTIPHDLVDRDVSEGGEPVPYEVFGLDAGEPGIGGVEIDPDETSLQRDGAYRRYHIAIVVHGFRRQVQSCRLPHQATPSERIVKEAIRGARTPRGAGGTPSGNHTI